MLHGSLRFYKRFYEEFLKLSEVLHEVLRVIGQIPGGSEVAKEEPNVMQQLPNVYNI